MRYEKCLNLCVDCRIYFIYSLEQISATGTFTFQVFKIHKKLKVVLTCYCGKFKISDLVIIKTCGEFGKSMIQLLHYATLLCPTRAAFIG